MNGWWKLKITGVNELTDIDREHIAKLIVDGFTEGEVIQEDDDTEDENDKHCT